MFLDTNVLVRARFMAVSRGSGCRMPESTTRTSWQRCSLTRRAPADGHPEPVRVHNSLDKVVGKAIPHGVYDLTCDAGWVRVGVDHDTASFVVETLRRWWRRMGCVSYPVAPRLLITVDGGGSNGSRNRLWNPCVHAKLKGWPWPAPPDRVCHRVVSILAPMMSSSNVWIPCSLFWTK